ncbi:MAG: hypothetical protein ACI4PE_03300 [Bacilli bacterium]
MIELQITLFDKNKKYKPMSTIVKIESIDYYNTHKAEVQKRAIENIAHQRKMLPSEIIKAGYTQVKTRVYDKEKIKEQQELQHKINLIKYIERKREERKESDNL